jgi:hypothetical protein
MTGSEQPSRDVSYGSRLCENSDAPLQSRIFVSISRIPPRRRAGHRRGQPHDCRAGSKRPRRFEAGRKCWARAPRSTPASRANAVNLSVERRRVPPPFDCIFSLTNRSVPNLRKRGARSISPRKFGQGRQHRGHQTPASIGNTPASAVGVDRVGNRRRAFLSLRLSRTFVQKVCLRAKADRVGCRCGPRQGFDSPTDRALADFLSADNR